MFPILRKPNGVPWRVVAALTTAVFGATAGLEWAAEPTPSVAEKQLSYRDIQLTVQSRDPVTGGNVRTTENAGSSHIKGFEADVLATPVRGFTLNGGGRWEYNSPISERYGRLVNLDFINGFGAAGSD